MKRVDSSSTKKKSFTTLLHGSRAGDLFPHFSEGYLVKYYHAHGKKHVIKHTTFFRNISSTEKSQVKKMTKHQYLDFYFTVFCFLKKIVLMYSERLSFPQ